MLALAFSASAALALESVDCSATPQAESPVAPGDVINYSLSLVQPDSAVETGGLVTLHITLSEGVSIDAGSVTLAPADKTQQVLYGTDGFVAVYDISAPPATVSFSATIGDTAQETVCTAELGSALQSVRHELVLPQPEVTPAPAPAATPEPMVEVAAPEAEQQFPIWLIIVLAAALILGAGAFFFLRSRPAQAHSYRWLS